MCVARSDGLHCPCIFSSLRWQRDTTWNNCARQVAKTGQGHHHGRQTLVTGSDTQHAGTQGKRPSQTPKDDGGVVPIWKTVKHPNCALCPAITRIGAKTCERDDLQSPKFFSGRLDKQPDLPMSRVIAKR